MAGLGEGDRKVPSHRGRLGDAALLVWRKTNHIRVGERILLPLLNGGRRVTRGRIARLAASIRALFGLGLLAAPEATRPPLTLLDASLPRSGVD